MLRKFSIVTFALSTTISVMGYLYPISTITKNKYFQTIIPFGDAYRFGPDWFHIFFVGLAVASLVGIFIFKEDSKSDSQPK